MAKKKIESDWDRAVKKCKDYVKYEGRAAVMIGNTRDRSDYSHLRLVSMENFFPAPGIQIYYAAFPERTSEDD